MLVPSISPGISSCRSMCMTVVVTLLVCVCCRLFQTTLALPLDLCLEESHDKSSQIPFKDNLEFYFYMSRSNPPSTFKLILEGDDDSSEQYFKFVRNGNKYDISTSTEEMSIRMATEGWKNWTLDVNSNNHLQLTCQDRVTLKVKLQAHKDVCYNLFLLTDYNFPRRFCYPDDNNMCVRTNTIPPKTTTTTTPETTTTTTSPETTTTTMSPETTTTTTSPETTTTTTSRETTTTTTSSETTSTTKAAIPAWPFTTATTSETIESEYTTTFMEIVVEEVSSAKGLPDAAGPTLLLAFVMLLA